MQDGGTQSRFKGSKVMLWLASDVILSPIGGVQPHKITATLHRHTVFGVLPADRLNIVSVRVQTPKHQTLLISKPGSKLTDLILIGSAPQKNHTHTDDTKWDLSVVMIIYSDRLSQLCRLWSTAKSNLNHQADAVSQIRPRRSRWDSPITSSSITSPNSLPCHPYLAIWFQKPPLSSQLVFWTEVIITDK